MNPQRLELVLVDVRDAVAILTLNRPERRNAWTIPMARELSDALDHCDATDGIRAVVITGGGVSFSVGADLSAGPIDSPGAESGQSESPGGFTTPRDVRKPVIAAINGDAVGAGMTLPLLCDLRIVARDARMAVPMVRRGVIPELAAHWTLPRIAGAGVAADLMLTGRLFEGAEAVRLGVCGEAVDRHRVLPRALEIAADLAAHTAPRAVAVTKYLLMRAMEADFAEIRAEELALFRRVAREPDAAEGVAAFLQKRAPRWTGRASSEPTWARVRPDEPDPC